MTSEKKLLTSKHLVYPFQATKDTTTICTDICMQIYKNTAHHGSGWRQRITYSHKHTLIHTQRFNTPKYSTEHQNMNKGAGEGDRGTWNVMRRCSALKDGRIDYR